MKAVAVVLNWRKPDETIACLTSIEKHAPGLDVLVVDNASGDGSPEKIRAAFPSVAVIEHPMNAGYVGGNNAGIRAALAAGADAVLVLNNDVVVRPGCVERLVEAIAGDPAAGIVAPVSLLSKDPSTVDFFTARIDLRNMAVHADGRDDLWRPPPAPSAPTEYVTGSALLIHRDVLERHEGPFDEAYFLVWEDVDLSIRVRRGRGPRRALLAVPGAEVHHARSASFGGEAAPLYNYFYVRNSFLIASRYAPRWHRARTLRMLERRYRGWVEKSAGATADAIARGLGDGLAGRFGPPPADLLPSAASPR